MQVKIKYLKDENGDILIKEKLQQIDIGNWIDLRSAEDVEMEQGEFRLISLGVCIELPCFHEAHIAPRSSTFKNFGILQTNSVGVIDRSFCGDLDVWRFPALAMRDTVINKGDRICQFRLMPIMGKINIKNVDKLDSISRGGFGSTGIK
jgi:dUTP pyrophosphatase